MNAVDRVIRWSTALAVLGVAGVAAIVSYEHASALVGAHGGSGWTGRLIPPPVDCPGSSVRLRSRVVFEYLEAG
jgi:hypothetical protein